MDRQTDRWIDSFSYIDIIIFSRCQWNAITDKPPKKVSSTLYTVIIYYITTHCIINIDSKTHSFTHSQENQREASTKIL